MCAAVELSITTPIISPTFLVNTREYLITHLRGTTKSESHCKVQSMSRGMESFENLPSSD